VRGLYDPASAAPDATPFPGRDKDAGVGGPPPPPTPPLSSLGMRLIGRGPGPRGGSAPRGRRGRGFPDPPDPSTASGYPQIFEEIREKRNKFQYQPEEVFRFDNKTKCKYIVDFFVKGVCYVFLSGRICLFPRSFPCAIFL